MRRQFSAILEQEGRWYTALCPEIDVASQGRTIEQALRNLQEAVELYLETASPAELRGLGVSRPLITTLDVRA